MRVIDSYYAPKMYIFEDLDYDPPRKSTYILDQDRPTKVEKIKGRGLVTVYRYNYFNAATLL